MFIEVNNVTLFYECKGSGHPLLLLHGNGEDHTIFNTLVESLSVHYTCYLIDTRGHGKSSEISDYHYTDMMEDIYQFISVLSLDKPYLLGFSDGGIIGLLLASKHPNLIDKYILCGVNFQPFGIVFRWQLIMKISYFFTRDKKVKMMLKEPGISIKEILEIKAKILVITGSKDMIKESHTKEMIKYINNSDWMIMQGYTHSNYIIKQAVLKDIVVKYLDTCDCKK